MDAKLETEITRLVGLNLCRLRCYWVSRLDGRPPPCRSANILRRILACKLQEKVHGALSPAAQKTPKDRRVEFPKFVSGTLPEITSKTRHNSDPRMAGRASPGPLFG